MVDTVMTTDPSEAEINEFMRGGVVEKEKKDPPEGGGEGGTPGTPGGGEHQPGAKAGEGHEEDDVLDDHEGGDETAKRDTELENAQDDAEREQIRERRRKERKDKRDRARAKQASLERQVESLTRQNGEMGQQLQTIMRHNHGAQVAAIDKNIEEGNNAVTYFKGVIEDATAKGDGKAMAEATEKMVQAREYVTQMSGLKERIGKQPAPGQPQLNPALLNHAKKFMSENPWYGGPRSSDPDSRVLTALDNSLAAENWDPSAPEYWEELKTRARKYLSHRFSGERQQPQNRSEEGEGAHNSSGSGTLPPADGRGRVPVAGASGDRNKGGGAQYQLSRERVQAIKEAGAWDDPKRRQAMIKRFQEYDADHKVESR